MCGASPACQGAKLPEAMEACLLLLLLLLLLLILRCIAVADIALYRWLLSVTSAAHVRCWVLLVFP